MVPYLRQSDYGKAAEVGAWQLAKYIADDAGVTLSGQPPAGRNRDGRGNIGFPVFWVILGLIIFFRVIGSLSGRGGGGSGGGGVLWFLLGMLASNSGRRSGGCWGGRGWGGGGFAGGAAGGGARGCCGVPHARGGGSGDP